MSCSFLSPDPSPHAHRLLVFRVSNVASGVHSDPMFGPGPGLVSGREPHDVTLGSWGK